MLIFQVAQLWLVSILICELTPSTSMCSMQEKLENNQNEIFYAEGNREYKLLVWWSLTTKQWYWNDCVYQKAVCNHCIHYKLILKLKNSCALLNELLMFTMKHGYMMAIDTVSVWWKESWINGSSWSQNRCEVPCLGVAFINNNIIKVPTNTFNACSFQE